jgi:hypothetical protein
VACFQHSERQPETGILARATLLRAGSLSNAEISASQVFSAALNLSMTFVNVGHHSSFGQRLGFAISAECFFHRRSPLGFLQWHPHPEPNVKHL